jgi:hypothetical protein
MFLVLVYSFIFRLVHKKGVFPWQLGSVKPNPDVLEVVHLLMNLNDGGLARILRLYRILTRVTHYPIKLFNGLNHVFENFGALAVVLADRGRAVLHSKILAVSGLGQVAMAKAYDL